MSIDKHLSAMYKIQQLLHKLNIQHSCAHRGNTCQSTVPLNFVRKDYRSQMAICPIVTIKLISTASQRQWICGASAARQIYKLKQENLWDVHLRVGAQDFFLISTPTPSPIHENHKSHASVLHSIIPFFFLAMVVICRVISNEKMRQMWIKVK